MSSHEPLKAHRKISAGSNRKFGFTFSFVFSVIGILPWILHGNSIKYWAIIVSLVFLLVSILKEDLLSPINELWFRFGQLLHSIISPLIMGVLFYGVFTPIGFLLRLFGKDILHLKFNKHNSYWVVRQPPGPEKGSMNNPF